MQNCTKYRELLKYDMIILQFEDGIKCKYPIYDNIVTLPSTTQDTANKTASTVRVTAAEDTAPEEPHSEYAYWK